MKRIIFLFLLLPLLVGCNGPQDQQHIHDSVQQDAPVCHSPTSSSEPMAPLPDMSLYQLDSRWTSLEGRDIALKELQGKIQLVAMIYTSCSYACPRIIADLRRIEEALVDYKRTDVGIVLITLDPERDTAEKLLEFALENKLNNDRWQLFTSTNNNIRELAALLNVRYQKANNWNISHSNIISVLNAGGEVVHQQEGLGIDPDETVSAITQLLLPM